MKCDICGEDKVLADMVQLSSHVYVHLSGPRSCSKTGRTYRMVRRSPAGKQLVTCASHELSPVTVESPDYIAANYPEFSADGDGGVSDAELEGIAAGMAKVPVVAK